MREVPSPTTTHQVQPYQTVADIIAERDALRKDAERYRWLRHEVKNGHDVERLFIPVLGFAIHDLDARIDREIALDAKYAAVGAA